MKDAVSTIRDRIIEDRVRDIREKGNELGFTIPRMRNVPTVPFGRKPLLICEIKRRSPSKGEIAQGLDAVEQALLYAAAGVKSVSVLTEERYFGGTLRDLSDVKNRCPGLSVLRKDFLLSVKDIDVSHRAGADAVLLIAGILGENELREMYDRTLQLGMQALVEVHTREDVEKIRSFKPRLIGINSRNLETFTIDPLLPLGIMGLADWEAEFVFESGIFSNEQAEFASRAGFAGILVGEAVVKCPELVADLIEGLGRGGGTCASRRFFWKSLAERKRPGRPLVKVCGITRAEDIRACENLGADILGFVLAPSPRKATLGFLRSSGRTNALKVAVVVGKAPSRPAGRTAEEELSLLPELLESGVIDAVQFHGDEAPDECCRSAFPYYKAIRIGSEDDIAQARKYLCPRVLFDAKTLDSYGGSGVRIPEYLVGTAAASFPLWIAGGIRPENAYGLIHDLRPELIDASSGLEREPGEKDPERLKAFFMEIERAGRRS